ncbi:MAG TPA: hypothetical protein VGL56_08930 [Fimbriimonadaceae bacterium]
MAADHLLFETTMDNLLLNISGPYGWPKFENGLDQLPNIPGVYLQTVAHAEGFLPWGVGITRRPMFKRFLEHTRKFEKGEYNILDLGAAQRGARELAWKGWGWTDEKRRDYENRKNEVIAAAQLQMIRAHIFVIEAGNTVRILERIEAALANHYYDQNAHGPKGLLIDIGMHLEPRRESEEPLTVVFQCRDTLIGMPSQIDI